MLTYDGGLLIHNRPFARYGNAASLTRAINKALDNAGIERSTTAYIAGVHVSKFRPGIAVLKNVWDYNTNFETSKVLIANAGEVLVNAGFTVAECVYLKNGKFYSSELLQIAAE